jgi:hypothetical protein
MNDRFQIARSRAKAKMLFMWHLATYIMASVVLIVINNATHSENQWWIWPALIWGTGVVGHFLRSFVLNNDLKKNLVERELENIDEDGE